MLVILSQGYNRPRIQCKKLQKDITQLEKGSCRFFQQIFWDIFRTSTPHSLKPLNQNLKNRWKHKSNPTHHYSLQFGIKIHHFGTEKNSGT